MPFTEDSASYYQAFYVIVDALGRVKQPLTPASLRDAIAATKITDPNNRAMINPSSEISFDETGEPQHANAYVVQWQKGKLVLLYPPAYADPADKAIWPYPAQ